MSPSPGQGACPTPTSGSDCIVGADSQILSRVIARSSAMRIRCCHRPVSTRPLSTTQTVWASTPSRDGEAHLLTGPRAVLAFARRCRAPAPAAPKRSLRLRRALSTAAANKAASVFFCWRGTKALLSIVISPSPLAWRALCFIFTMLNLNVRTCSKTTFILNRRLARRVSSHGHHLVMCQVMPSLNASTKTIVGPDERCSTMSGTLPAQPQPLGWAPQPLGWAPQPMAGRQSLCLSATTSG